MTPHDCEIFREDLREGGLCPLCNHRAVEHQSRLQNLLFEGNMADAKLPPRWRRWTATNPRTQMGLGNVSLLGALRFAVDQLMSGHGRTRLQRSAR